MIDRHIVRVIITRSQALTNPYRAPAANLAAEHASVMPYEPAVLSRVGRIGRLRFISYSFWLGSAAFVGISIAVSMLGNQFMVRHSVLVGWVTIAAMLAIGTVYGIRRLHDMGVSGWWALMCMLPPLNILLWLALACFPGQSSGNRHGPPALKNGWPAITGASLGILAIVVITILLAIGPALAAFVQYSLLPGMLSGSR